jgi:hypothetical protein
MSRKFVILIACDSGYTLMNTVSCYTLFPKCSGDQTTEITAYYPGDYVPRTKEVLRTEILSEMIAMHLKPHPRESLVSIPISSYIMPS